MPLYGRQWSPWPINSDIPDAVSPCRAPGLPRGNGSSAEVDRRLVRLRPEQLGLAATRAERKRVLVSQSLHPRKAVFPLASCLYFAVENFSGGELRQDK
jgi:hypothetical protein